jgi:hypothetical protein
MLLFLHTNQCFGSIFIEYGSGSNEYYSLDPDPTFFVNSYPWYPAPSFFVNKDLGQFIDNLGPFFLLNPLRVSGCKLLGEKPLKIDLDPVY